MKVKETSIKNGSLIAELLPADYTDVFECTFKSDKNFTADDILVSLWTDFPGWLNALFKLRNIIVSPFGLKGGKRDSKSFEECIRTGESFEIASVAAKSENETVLCLNDSHLIAYLSVEVMSSGNDRKLLVSTLVKFHNRLGKVYFFFIQPFHKIVVINMLKHVVKVIK